MGKQREAEATQIGRVLVFFFSNAGAAEILEWIEENQTASVKLSRQSGVG